jgi:putative PEP-CTERM system TPR-repeat lipoprotein
LQNALRVDGNSAEARWLLGKLYLDTGEFLAAEKELQRAQELGWTDNDIRPALAKSLLVQGKFEDVLAFEYQDLNAVAASQLLSNQALAALSAGHSDKAGELVALALSRDAQSVDAKLAEATIAIRTGDPDGALTRIEALLATAPDIGMAWGVKGQALLEQGKLPEARAAFDEAIARSNFALVERVARGLISLQLKDYAAAQSDATELLRLNPRSPAGNYLQGLLHFHNKQYRAAITALTLAEPATSQFPSVPYYLSVSYLLEKDVDLAVKFASQYVTQSPDDSRGRQLLATLLIKQGKPREAAATLQPIIDHDPDNVVALNLLANALLLDGQADIALVLYARIAQMQPEWSIIPLRQETGLITQDFGSPEGALAGSQAAQNAQAQVKGQAPFPQGDILEILAYLRKKDFPNAIEAAKSYQYRDLEHLAPYHVLGMVYIAAGQITDARQVFEKALKRDPGDPASNQALAQLALVDKDIDTARTYYQNTLDRYPGDLTTLMQLAALEFADKREAAMLARLNEAMDAHPTVLEPRLRLAGYYLGAGSPEKVTPLFAPLSTLQRQSIRVLELTALAQLALKQHDTAFATLQQLVAAKPDSAQFRYLLAIAANETGDQQRTKQELQEAVKLNPKHVPSLINLARIAHNEGERELFEQYLGTVIELAPDNVEVLRLRAVSALSREDTSEGLAHLQRVFDMAPDTQSVMELAAVQKAAGKPGDARTTLQKWIKDNPGDVIVRLRLADELMLANNVAGARAQYVAALTLDPDNVLILNNLAWNLRLEDPQKALEYIRRATRIAPHQPNLLDTLAVIESLNGNHKAAQDTIGRALAGAPHDASMRYHQAMIEAELGETESAVAALELLLAENTGDFPERSEAESLLHSLKVGGSQEAQVR